MSVQLAPVPHSSVLTDDGGILVPIWADWFQRLLKVNNDWADATTASGYAKLPSGIYIQWGVTAALATATTTTIALPTSFPNACLQVIAGIQANPASSTAATGHFGTGNYTIAGFDMYNRTSATYTFNYIAVGF